MAGRSQSRLEQSVVEIGLTAPRRRSMRYSSLKTSVVTLMRSVSSAFGRSDETGENDDVGEVALAGGRTFSASRWWGEATRPCCRTPGPATSPSWLNTSVDNVIT